MYFEAFQRYPSELEYIQACGGRRCYLFIEAILYYFILISDVILSKYRVGFSEQRNSLKEKQE